MNSPVELIALYGSLRRGQPGCQTLKLDDHLIYMSPCLISGDLYDLGTYPGLKEGKGTVVGDLFRLPSRRGLARLDRFENYVPSSPGRSLYLRKPVALIEPPVTAWCYLYNRSVLGLHKITHGDWVEYAKIRASIEQSKK